MLDCDSQFAICGRDQPWVGVGKAPDREWANDKRKFIGYAAFFGK
jgi:hypothetical protein